MRTISIIGGGAWGVALASVAQAAGNAVTLWAREGVTQAHLYSTRRTPALPHVPLAPEVQFADAFPVSDTYIFSIPAQQLRAVLTIFAARIPHGTTLIIAAKGYEIETGKSLPDVVAELCPHAVPVLLSGPSFAGDVVQGKPTAVVIAAAQESLAKTLCERLSTPSFRPYWSTDMQGVALGGALKNVYAIAAGLTIGLGLGESARAALLARSFAELQRLAIYKGARSDTLHGLSGFGDLVLTSTSEQSRNYRFGLALGVGKTLQEAQAEIGLVEGIATAKAFGQHNHEIDMPILMSIYAVVTGAATPQVVMMQLLARPLKSEY